MMSGIKGWNRRSFVQLMGATVLASHAAGLTCLADTLGNTPLNDGTILFVGCTGKEGDRIEVLTANEGKLKLTQRVEAERPAAMVLSSDRRVLYVVNEIAQFQGLPRGTAEAYSIDHKGSLTLLNRQPLSLSATMPKHVALSADGKSLAVTAQSGSILNHLPVLEDGSLGRVDGIFKLTGDGNGRASQPRITVFDAEHRLISVDSGTGSLRILSKGDSGLELHNHCQLSIQASPQHMAISHKTDVIYLASESGIHSYVYDRETGKVLKPLQTISTPSNRLIMHPSGHLLFSSHASNGLYAWSISPNGILKNPGRIDEVIGDADLIDASPDGRHLLAVSTKTGLVSVARTHPDGSLINNLQLSVPLDSPKSFAVIYA